MLKYTLPMFFVNHNISGWMVVIQWFPFIVTIYMKRRVALMSWLEFRAQDQSSIPGEG